MTMQQPRTTQSPTFTDTTRYVPVTTQAGFSSLDLVAGFVATLMILGPLAMAAWGARAIVG